MTGHCGVMLARYNITHITRYIITHYWSEIYIVQNFKNYQSLTYIVLYHIYFIIILILIL